MMHDSFTGTGAESLARNLGAIRQRYPTAEPEWVAEVVRAVLAAMSGQPSPQQSALLAEVEDLGRTIANAKAEIVALKIDDITDNHIPFATDELDAIVSHTASATNAILESCEALDNLGSELSSEQSSRLQDATTQIYEACSFQDITGQRISKVVNTLKNIDSKVATILSTFAPAQLESAAPATRPQESLLNGPQLPDEAMEQTEIDRLLASFD